MQTIQNRTELSNAYLHHVFLNYHPVLSGLQQVSLLAKICTLWFPVTEKYFSFPSPQKLNFQIPIRPGMVDEETLCGCATSKSLSVYSFIYHFPPQ